MPPHEKPTMKARILETADRLFYQRGIRAVGVDTIAAEIGISKRTLYNHFPSKDELIAAYLAGRFTNRTSAVSRSITSPPGVTQASSNPLLSSAASSKPRALFGTAE